MKPRSLVAFGCVLFLTISVSTPAEAATGHPAEEVIRLNEQAIKLNAAGNHAGAIALTERAVAERERVFGPTHHPNTVNLLSNLAGYYSAQGRLADAERVEKKALAVNEKVRRPEHRDTAATLFKLADI